MAANQLERFLEDQRKSILQAWLGRILSNYPAEARRFWASPNDPFSNPIGSTFAQGLEGILEGLGQGAEISRLADLLDPIIHVRAIQGLSPSEALAFVLDLKRIIREEWKRKKKEEAVGEDFWEMESRIDQLSLRAFDQYVRCRKKVHELELKELRSRIFSPWENRRT